MALNSWSATLSENAAFKQRHQLSSDRVVKTLFYIPVVATYYWFKETITTESFSYVGMTEAAATSCAAAMVTAYTENVVTATVDQTDGTISTTTKSICTADIRAIHDTGLMWHVDVDINKVATAVEALS